VPISNNDQRRHHQNSSSQPRKAVLAGGLHSGGRRAAAIYTLIETCKLNDVDPRAWLADVLASIADHPAKRIADLLPWNWKAAQKVAAAVAA
jgi:transposase